MALRQPVHQAAWHTAPTSSCRVSPSQHPQSTRSQHPVSRARFAEKPPLFPEINPRSSPVQTNFYLVLFLFIQVPGVSRNSKPGPDFI